MKRIWSLAVVTLGVVALVATGFVLSSRAAVSTVGELGFENELRIPPLVEPRLGAERRKVFELELKAGNERAASRKGDRDLGRERGLPGTDVTRIARGRSRAARPEHVG